MLSADAPRPWTITAVSRATSGAGPRRTVRSIAPIVAFPPTMLSESQSEREPRLLTSNTILLSAHDLHGVCCLSLSEDEVFVARSEHIVHFFDDDHARV